MTTGQVTVLDAEAFAREIDALLPQTQCTRCGFDACRPYAQAIARGEAKINRCPPGGAAGIGRLARLTGQPVLPLDPECGSEAARTVAWIDARYCIGCTLCIQACPVDAIIGASKGLHAVIDDQCTGCDLCVSPCPVDCITMRPVVPAVPWSDQQAGNARQRYESRQRRLAREAQRLDRSLTLKAQAELARPSTEVPFDDARFDEVRFDKTPCDKAPSDEAAARRKRLLLDAAMAKARARLSAARVDPAVPARSGDPT